MQPPPSRPLQPSHLSREQAREQLNRARNNRNRLYNQQIDAVKHAEQAVLAYQQAERELLQASNAVAQLEQSHITQIPDSNAQVDVTIDVTTDNVHPAYVGSTQTVQMTNLNPDITNAGVDTGTNANADADARRDNNIRDNSPPDIAETESESEANATATTTTTTAIVEDVLNTFDIVSPAPLQNISESHSRLTVTRPLSRNTIGACTSTGAGAAIAADSDAGASISALFTDDSPPPRKFRTPVAPSGAPEDDNSIVPAAITNTPNTSEAGLFFDITPGKSSAKTPLKKRKPKFLSTFVSPKNRTPQIQTQVEVETQDEQSSANCSARRSKRTRKQVSYNYDDPSSDIFVTNPNDVHLLDWDEVKRIMPKNKSNYKKSKRLKSHPNSS